MNIDSQVKMCILSVVMTRHCVKGAENKNKQVVLPQMLWQVKRRLKYLILRDRKWTFAFGFVIGAFLAAIVSFFVNHPLFISSIWPDSATVNNLLSYDTAIYDFDYEKWLERTFNAQSCSLDPDSLRYTNRSQFTTKKCGNVKLKESESFRRDSDPFDPRTEANFLFEKINVACVVMTKDIIKATAIKDTWGGHCNSIIFASSKLLEVSEEMRQKNHSILVTNPAKVNQFPAASEFALLCKSLHHLFQERKNELQWILVVGEETFAIPENLRFYVASKNPKDKHYLGHAMKFWNVIYNWADAGYVISKGTLNRFMINFPDEKSCDAGGQFWKNSDWYMGKHLASMDIHPVDTRDHIKRSRFIGHSLKKFLFPGGVSVFERYWRDSLYLSKDGPHCCSNFAITFHLSTSTTRMFQFYYLYYHLRAFYGGGEHGNQILKSKSLIFQALTLDERLKEEALQKMMSKKVEN